jgi:hypothetical protein
VQAPEGGIPLKRRRQEPILSEYTANVATNSMDVSNNNSDQQMIQIPAGLFAHLMERVATLEALIQNNPQINKNQQKNKNNNNNNGATNKPSFDFDLGQLKSTIKDHEKRVPLGTTADSQWADLFKTSSNTNKNTNNKKQKNTEIIEKTTSKKNKKPENTNKKYFSNTKVGLERAHRAFSEPSTTPSSYEFIHIPCNRRISKYDARALLTQIGVQQSCVIDIQFPARNTVSFFVHSEFATKFRELIAKHNFKEKEQFNFFDETIIANPAFASLGQAEKKKLAKEIYTKRMVHLCTEKLVAKPFLGRSIARFLANTTTDLNIPATNFGVLFKSNTPKQSSSSDTVGTRQDTPIVPIDME